MKVVALISGGKDSTFSMMQTIKYGHTLVALANLYPPPTKKATVDTDELDSYMFQTVGHSVVEAYEQCLELPLFRRALTGSSKSLELTYSHAVEGDEVEDLYNLLQSVKQKIPDVQAVCSGAVLSDYQRLRVENVCQRLGLTSLSYLWRRDQTELLHEMVDRGVSAILIKVAALGLSPKHLGQNITSEGLVDHLISIHKQYGCHPCGEGGEYETVTLDCPLFKKRIVIDNTQVVTRSADETFAPVAYLKILSYHLEEKEVNEWDISTPPKAPSPHTGMGRRRGSFEAVSSSGKSKEYFINLASNMLTRIESQVETEDEFTSTTHQTTDNASDSDFGSSLSSSDDDNSNDDASSVASSQSRSSKTSKTSKNDERRLIPSASSLLLPSLRQSLLMNNSSFLQSVTNYYLQNISMQFQGTNVPMSSCVGGYKCASLLLMLEPEIVLPMFLSHSVAQAPTKLSVGTPPHTPPTINPVASLSTSSGHAHAALTLLPETEMFSILLIIQKYLTDYLQSSSLSDTVYCRLYLGRMSTFKDINQSYNHSSICQGKSVPSRSCVEVSFDSFHQHSSLISSGSSNVTPISSSLLSHPSISAKSMKKSKNGIMIEVITTRQPRSVLHVQSISEWAPACIGPYSQATTVGGLIRLAGQIGQLPATMELVPGGVERQTLQICRNLDAILSCLNIDVSHLLFVTVFITRSDFIKSVRATWKHYTRSSVLLCCSYICVPALPKGALVEIQVTAIGKVANIVDDDNRNIFKDQSKESIESNNNSDGNDTTATTTPNIEDGEEMNEKSDFETFRRIDDKISHHCTYSRRRGCAFLVSSVVGDYGDKLQDVTSWAVILLTHLSSALHAAGDLCLFDCLIIRLYYSRTSDSASAHLDNSKRCQYTLETVLTHSSYFELSQVFKYACNMLYANLYHKYKVNSLASKSKVETYSVPSFSFIPCESTFDMSGQDCGVIVEAEAFSKIVS